MKPSDILLVVLILGFAALTFLRPTDPTDLDKLNRSGLRYYKDYGTGCEYVGNMFDIGPRLDSNGKHVCN